MKQSTQGALIKGNKDYVEVVEGLGVPLEEGKTVPTMYMVGQDDVVEKGDSDLTGGFGSSGDVAGGFVLSGGAESFDLGLSGRFIRFNTSVSGDTTATPELQSIEITE